MRSHTDCREVQRRSRASAGCACAPVTERQKYAAALASASRCRGRRCEKPPLLRVREEIGPALISLVVSFMPDMLAESRLLGVFAAGELAGVLYGTQRRPDLRDDDELADEPKLFVSALVESSSSSSGSRAAPRCTIWCPRGVSSCGLSMPVSKRAWRLGRLTSSAIPFVLRGIFGCGAWRCACRSREHTPQRAQRNTHL